MVKFHGLVSNHFMQNVGKSFAFKFSVNRKIMTFVAYLWLHDTQVAVAETRIVYQ